MKSFCHIYAQWDQTGDRIDEELGHLLGLGLTADAAFAWSQAEDHAPALRRLAAAGDLCAPNVYPRDCDPAARDPNWWKYSLSECRRLLERAAARYSGLDLGRMEAVNTYTPGNSLVAACRELGIGYLLGFCAPIVIEDGGWEIAHYGAPLSPYFASAEDYRKPAPSGAPGGDVLIASMELRNPMVCLNHWGEGPWCPLNAQAADRWLEPSGEPRPFLQIAEDWLRQSAWAGRPLFFHLNLQYFFAGRCYAHNRRALEWVARQRDQGRLEVGGLKAWRERLAAHGGFQRQTSYWRGEMMGFHVGHRPGCFPDVVVDESLDRQGVWQRPDPLPKRFYDYGVPWNWPAFEPRGDAPASESFGDVAVSAKPSERAGAGRRWKVEIENRGPRRRLPLLLWEAGKNLAPPFRVNGVSPGWRARLVPHPAGVGAAVLLEGEAGPGGGVIEFEIEGTPAAGERVGRSWPGLVEAQTFFELGRPYTVLAAQTPEPFVVLARVRRGPRDREPVIVESLVGIEHERRRLASAPLALRFDGTRLACWHRFWGVAADQIELEGVEEAQARLRAETQAKVRALCPGLAPNAPGYQLFGNIREPARWDRGLARAAGSLEIKRMNEWFQKQRPGMGEIVVEAHPGVFLPRGSITKVLGHEFDAIRCAEGYGFRELCVDYPQAWDWGAAAWVQWRHLRVSLEGLQANRGGAFFIHLHAFDPEERDLAQRVHLFNPAATEIAPLFEAVPVHQTAELCAVNEWVLPQGIEGRWQPEALCSIRVPEDCRRWPSLGVWVAPLEKSTLYDWVEERGAPGLLSHVWVTHHSDKSKSGSVSKSKSKPRSARD